MAKVKKSPADLAESITFKAGGKTRVFDIDQPDLPGWLENSTLESGDYPYREKMPRKEYEKTLEDLQIELVKMQHWLKQSNNRVLALFEGRDAAGKGGTINVIRQYLNPRTARNVALTKPTETERGQWYFQRYINHFPTEGEFVTFDRSWYNRGVVEPVMGFCTPEQNERFLTETPKFEHILSENGTYFFKFWLNIGREMQLKRFHDRRHSQLKHWKFSPIDIAGMSKWDEYTRYRDLMINRTHTDHAPWTIVRANDKRRARLEVIRKLLMSLPYDDRDLDVIGTPDPDIIGYGPAFLDQD